MIIDFYGPIFVRKYGYFHHLNFVYFLIQRTFFFKFTIFNTKFDKLGQKLDFLACPLERRYYSDRSDLTFDILDVVNIDCMQLSCTYT